MPIISAYCAEAFFVLKRQRMGRTLFFFQMTRKCLKLGIVTEKGRLKQLSEKNDSNYLRIVREIANVFLAGCSKLSELPSYCLCLSEMKKDG